MKFTAAFALAVWLVVTGWLATMVIVKPAVLHLGNDADETAEMAQLRGAIEHNRQMQERVALLRQSAYTDGNQPLLALPSAPPTATDGGAAAPRGATGTSGDPSTHTVSVVLVANGQRSAIIDGRHVRAGTRLADGSRVAAIGADWVRIESSDGARAVHAVPSPYQPASGAAR
ncbi:hypothetical protein CQ393_14695 [Stenotrophomonas sp. MYb238]|uniref:hypothetical protein n=1 Tax=Stenotrophomonas sp. MYb238 TaxID=2040281 RepID=UPI001291B26B|nr:hypothetical protein [Stenotrophomonas sp. MYb238]MQP77129.1 hypothetical protein [Stenotrophomonas sp. MYb238]